MMKVVMVTMMNGDDDQIGWEPVFQVLGCFFFSSPVNGHHR
jgi:hypothetical protein